MPKRPVRGRGRRKVKSKLPKYIDPRGRRPSEQDAYTTIVAEVGDTFGSIAEDLGISVEAVIKANEDVTEIKADAVYNVPTMKDAPPAFYDPIFETAPISPEGIQYPEAMSPELFAQYGQTMGTEEFAYEDIGIGKYYQQDYFAGVENVEDLQRAVAEFREDISERKVYSQYGQQYGERPDQKLLDEGKYYQEGMFEMPGMPLKYRWEQDEQGNWVDRGPEATFDALYEMNGIDPNDPDMVEWFWGFADEDLLFMGEFFDVIEYPTGGGRGGGGGYGGAGVRRTTGGGRVGAGAARGDYASYLSLTSWSI